MLKLPGQMESTFMRTSGQRSNLLALLADDPTVRDTVVEMVNALDQTTKEDARGSRLASMLDPSSPSYPLDTSRALTLSAQDRRSLHSLISQLDPSFSPHLQHPREAINLDEVSLHGVCYAPMQTPRYRNSAIIFKPTGSSEPRAGVIHRIFRYSHLRPGNLKVDGCYLAVREYLPVTTTQDYPDPYPAFGFAAGYLCEKEPQNDHIISLSQVESHCTVTTFEDIKEWKEFVHILPVDRLMLSFRFEMDEAPDAELGELSL
ncbi:hypothetical protein BDN72DRAFT_946470 [Pluteus cervinus]|uniref:Uncharacterized protein n=1 Tax=Pluteus cervinus TaxID=181527 RepID=A0ACD3AU05_9AGAR|nr:hypothetical protein BDN72DRAFT_946470 [Pluteus cervinus]